MSATKLKLDILTSETSRVFYNLDYSSFFNGVWRESKRETLYDNVSGELYKVMVESESLPFTAIITSVTFLELLQSFLKRVETQKEQSRFIVDRVQQIRRNIQSLRSTTPNDPAGISLRQSQMQSHLDSLNESVGKTLEQAVRRAELLLGKNGKVLGAGDALASRLESIRFNQTELDNLFDRMYNFRAARDPKSDPDERNFRYMIDVVNIYISQKLNQMSNGDSICYVSKGSYTSDFCGDFGRTPLVPLFWLKSQMSPEFASAREQADFFGSLSQQAGFIYNRFLVRNDFSDQPSDFNYDLLQGFNTSYMRQLDIIRSRDLAEVDPDNDRLFTDKNFIRRELDGNIAQAERAFVRIFNDFGGIYSDDLIESGGIDKLEHYRKLVDRVELQIKKREL